MKEFPGGVRRNLFSPILWWFYRDQVLYVRTKGTPHARLQETLVSDRLDLGAVCGDWFHFLSELGNVYLSSPHN